MQGLGPSLSGGEVDHQDPLRLECGLVSWCCVLLDHDCGRLVDEIASSWRCLLLGSGFLSAGLWSLPFLMSAPLLRWEAGVRPYYHHPQWKCLNYLSGQSILYPWCGCDGTRWSLCGVPPRRGEAGAPLPILCREELLSGVIHHGVPRGWHPIAT
jgi:hypothetical protein